MIVTWPEDTQTAIEEIIEQIGRGVDFVQITYSGCSVCSLDPITNTSTDSFCPVCSGLYWIPVSQDDIEITAHITWKPSDVLEWESGGQLFTGDCLVKIIYSEENADYAENAAYLVVDGKEMNIKRTTLLGVPTINRILLETVEKEKEHA